MARVVGIDGEIRTLLRDWRCAAVAPDAEPADGDFIPTRVPGTAVQALIEAGRWSWDDPAPLDERDVWYRCDVEADGPKRLQFDGLATIADVFLDGEKIASSHSMFVPLTCDVDFRGKHRLDICFRALTPSLENKSRARWRPRMIQPAGLRNVRTTALGRMPGFAPPAPPVGPWRDITLVPHNALRVLRADVKSRLEDSTGILDVVLELENAPHGEATLTCAGMTTRLQTRKSVIEGTLRIPDVAQWWPHTHGAPSLHEVVAQIGDAKIDLGRVGFRNIKVDRGADGRGFGLIVNGEPIFCRGVVWTPADPIGLDSSRETLAPLLRQAREAGMNMLRVGGTFVYESDAFFDLCDELGILVWHDFQFANFDYPIGEPDFRGLVEQEARAFLDRTQGSPALAILCGGSEVYQQAAMMGVPEKNW
ncbi:MAG: glycoside hydrolase family 2 protein, partial [Methylobacteriaceae bacterium]|nr:glycoside hydrolase family 2 protein [Methylobacteriaceae bacterium]